MLTNIKLCDYNWGMTQETVIEILGKGGARAMPAEKGRKRLTIYLDADLYTEFLREAEIEFRSFSDHMNSILAERYREQKTAASAKDSNRTNGRH